MESSSGGTNNRMKLSAATDCMVATNCIRYTLTSVTSGSGAGHGVDNEISFNVTGQNVDRRLPKRQRQGAAANTGTLIVSP